MKTRKIVLFILVTLMFLNFGCNNRDLEAQRSEIEREYMDQTDKPMDVNNKDEAENIESEEEIYKRILFEKAQEMISTPIPRDAIINNKDNSASLSIISGGKVDIMILPDLEVEKQTTAGSTYCYVKYGKMCYTSSNDYIIEIQTPSLSVTIQTKYLIGTDRESNSAYGKGTTEEDKESGKTTLRYHEGCHGEAFIMFLQLNPTPEFKGKIGMRVVDYEKAIRVWKEQTETYVDNLMKYGDDFVDNVGTTKEQYENSNEKNRGNK